MEPGEGIRMTTKKTKPTTPQGIPVAVPVGLVAVLIAIGTFFGITGKSTTPSKSTETEVIVKTAPESKKASLKGNPVLEKKVEPEIPKPIEPTKGPSGGKMN
jgi:hypothetical protein